MTAKQNCSGTVVKQTCVNCHKKVNSLFDELSKKELEILERDRTVADYRRGETIYKEGSRSMGLLCLNAGKVKLVREDQEGELQIMGLRKPVDFIDLRTAVTDLPLNHSAIALEDSSVCFIERENFLKVLSGNPDLMVKVIRMIADEVDRGNQRLLSNTRKQINGRVAEAILQLKDFFGTKTDGKTLDMYFLRSDLASLSNTSVENVIRTLSAWTKQGILVSEHKRLKILNETMLKRLSREEQLTESKS